MTHWLKITSRTVGIFVRAEGLLLKGEGWKCGSIDWLPLTQLASIQGTCFDQSSKCPRSPSDAFHPLCASRSHEERVLSEPPLLVVELSPERMTFSGVALYYGTWFWEKSSIIFNSLMKMFLCSQPFKNLWGFIFDWATTLVFWFWFLESFHIYFKCS